MKIKKSTDWGTILLYIAVIILGLLFIYELMKLIAAGKSLAEAAATAFSNTVGQIESALTGLLTGALNPLTLLPSLLSFLPNFLSLLFPFILSLPALFLSFIGSITGSSIGNLFGSAAPMTTGAGSSYTVPVSNSTDPQNPVQLAGDGINSFSVTK